MSNRPGCLLFGLPGRPAALGRGRSLPRLELSSIHAQDRALVRRAHAAAAGAHEALFARDHGVSDAVLADLGGDLVAVVSQLHALGHRLAEARVFLSRNDPDRLARDRAEVELNLVGSGASEMLAQRSQMQALRERGELAGRVRDDLRTLTARLETSAGELQAFRARIDGDLASGELVHELRAYHRSAEAALQAFEATRIELARP